MAQKKDGEKNGVISSLFMAHFIILFHIIIIGVVGLLVLFLAGFAHYITIILLAGFLLIGGLFYYFYRRMKNEGKNIREILKSPMFEGRTVEVSFLGGVASLKIGKSNDAPMLSTNEINYPKLLEAPDNSHIRELERLAGLLEKELITLEEYNKAKEKILDSFYLER
ncbi:MAG: hypothetical protein HQK78_14060 [Desulfobacterales bacterium]|nr:hypothetical protein [Desulfobacterales bacterium]